MRINLTSRHRSIAAVLGVLVLILALFGWGLQYKLSLYERPGGHPSPMPHAKLLSQKERPSSSNTVGLVNPVDPQPQSPVFSPALVIAAILIGSYIVMFLRMLITTLVSDSGQLRSAASNYFAFRPPPAIISSN
jgi:energy-converting hydrogenase Eha subunit F